MQEFVQCKQVMIGLPRTGKTTFLAALWHVVQSGEVPESLQLVELHGERTHLNNICENWLGCQALERTFIGTEEKVAMKLAQPPAGLRTELVLPDLSGESFRNQWERREWTKEYNDLAIEAVGILLFIHPREVTEPIRIGPATERMAAAIDAIGGASNDQRESEEEPTPWTPGMAPTQVKLVELLQFLMSGPFASRTLRLAVVISAWDLVMQYGESPSAWLTRRLTLLDQYLKSNSHYCQFKVYGVSAQGGELENSKKILSKKKPSERIIIVGDKSEGHNITAPIQWVMG